MKTTYLQQLSLVFLLWIISPVLFADDFAKLVQSCEKCHDKDGNSTTPDVPIIAGFSYDGFLNTMYVFRLGQRIALKFHKPGEPETVMNDIARSLSDEEVDKLARHFSKTKFRAPKQDVNPALAQKGEALHKRYCDKCHTDNGAHPVEDAAILAGQWTPYLRRQFANFLSGKRMVPRTMLRRIEKMSAEDIEALLNFYAREGQR